MVKIIAFIVAKWRTLLIVVGLLVLSGLLLYHMLRDRPTQVVVEVAAPEPIDSVFTQPSRPEQTAQARWDSLKTIQP